ncbi:MAG TPA: CHAT domain-containing protein [Thermoanaerobaculia bacterium]|jgi:CHAT domain-containing protein/tetratricopeptide (TPR) repeat protein|nr:CHAT domain-containing protein [Thermoanaerobaculia bacterium]
MRPVGLSRLTRLARLIVATALALALPGCPAARTPSPDGAVVVVEVQPGGAGEMAGLLAGDRILTLRRAGAPPVNPDSVEIEPSTCLAAAQFEIEQAPRGPVEIEIERDTPGKTGKSVRRTFALEADDWRLRLGVEHATTPTAKAWDHLRQASIESDAHRAAPAEAEYAAAERLAVGRRDDRFLALIRQRRADSRINANDFPGALADIRSAVEIRRRTEPGTLAAAQGWSALGRVQNRMEELDGAKLALENALRIQSIQAPGSLALANTENNLGLNAGIRGDVDAADRHFRAALAIAERKMPEGRTTASLLINLGNVARLRSRLDEAERFQHRAFALWRRLEPTSPKVPDILLNLANVAVARGDLDRADGFLQAALEANRTLGLEGQAAAGALAGLGLLAERRGNFAEAEARQLEALAIFTRLAPEGPSVARTLTNLATAANAQGAPTRAEGYAARALALHRKIEPGSPILAYDLINLAEIAAARNDKATTRARIAEALGIVERLPATLDPAASMRRASALLLDLGTAADLRLAEKSLKSALAIYERFAPGTAEQVDALGLLGRLERRLGRTADAERHFAQALEALDKSVRRLGGSDLDETRFRAQFARLYQEAIELRVELGQPQEAYRTLERFRARSLLDLLGERDLAPPAELPAELVEQTRRIDAQLARFESDLGALDPATASNKIEELIARRARVFGERENLRAQIRRISPRFAALAAPVPLDSVAARKTLAAGEIGLAYSVGVRRTTLFVLMPEGLAGASATGLAVASIPLGREALGREVAAFRSLMLAGQGVGTDRALRSAGARLFSLLLAPASPWLERAERLRISADGPLAALPFAALVVPASKPGAPAPVYLAERWPLSTVLSSTLAAELGRMRGETPAADALVAFGDPHYSGPTGTAASRGPRPSVRFRAGLAPLPASRGEVQQVAGLFRPARSFLGAEATEARFLSEAPRGRIVHFAGHALLDPRFPLDSALALSAPLRAARAGDDGLLQAWEIFERLRLSADLVTLSACETALGTEAQGEGLLGLTRAFHYAGARTVLSSLWSVSDRSTAELMRRFYAHLGAGAAKDQALALAQREMLAGPYRHPYHWAAFQLDGDWR